MDTATNIMEIFEKATEKFNESLSIDTNAKQIERLCAARDRTTSLATSELRRSSTR